VRLRGYKEVDSEMEEMRQEARRATSIKTFTLKQLLTAPELKLPVIIACFLQVSQQWSGINAVSRKHWFNLLSKHFDAELRFESLW